MFIFSRRMDLPEKTDRDFNLNSINSDEGGITVINGVAYVSDTTDNRIYAYCIKCWR